MRLFFEFFAVLFNSIKDIAPIMVILIGFQVLVLRKPIANLQRLVIGFLAVLLGLTLFIQGLELALFPLGELMAAELTDPAFIAHSTGYHGDQWQAYIWVYLFAAALGFATTLAEPSLIAVAGKAEQISAGGIDALGLRLAVAIGVAFGIALGTYRIVTGMDLWIFIISGYVIVLIQTSYAPKMIIGLAYDSGGVTTSTVTVPLVTALGLGLATSVPNRNPIVDGFGLIAFASLFPIMTVLGYAQLAEWRSRSK
ncbi:MAG: DUF1538 domain-containing protein [Gammaproteobacteria bacterium]|nr:DUF1538 domain-containing protein [Gammaproteobacteria bacterium]